MLKRSLQDELDEFFRAIQRGDVSERLVSKGAFSQARKKFKHTAFIELNREQVGYFYEHFTPLTWKGKRLLAVDGSMADLPDTAKIVSHFGRWGSLHGEACPKARLSQMFDVLNKVTVDALIAPKSKGERSLAHRHLDYLEANDLLLMDRGYPAYWLFKAILAKGAHFCARLDESKWQAAKELLKSNKAEQIVTLPLADTSRKLCINHGLSDDPITLRLVRIILPNQNIVVLATSLLDREAFPFEAFQALYHQRWPVETDYRHMKTRLKVELWSGKTVESIYQDFHATIFSKNLAAIVSQPAQKVVDHHIQHRKYRYQVNMSNLFSKMKDTIVLLFKRSRIGRLLNQIWKQMINTIEPVRANRTFERNKKFRQKNYKNSYKPIR